MMNGELVSTTNKKYMYKSYFETILNNSHLTKKYQLKMSGYFGNIWKQGCKLYAKLE